MPRTEGVPNDKHFCKISSFYCFVALIAALGALNWGVVSLLNFDAVKFLFGDSSLMTRLIYLLVGVSGGYLLLSTIKDLMKP